MLTAEGSGASPFSSPDSSMKKLNSRANPEERGVPPLVSWVLDDDQEVVLICRDRKEEGDLLVLTRAASLSAGGGLNPDRSAIRSCWV